ncbi:MAG: hypothetical protein NVSMB18_16620 [Acetobacteraceae bacterium]
MLRSLTLAAVLLLGAAAPLLGAAAPLLGAAAPPPGAASCSGCHAAGSGAGPIAGRGADALAATMLAYRTGQLPSTLMGRLMKGLSPEQIQAIAAWVSAQG